MPLTIMEGELEGEEGESMSWHLAGSWTALMADRMLHRLN